MSDLIDRQAAINALDKIPLRGMKEEGGKLHALVSLAQVWIVLEQLPSAEPERFVCAEVKLPKEEIQEAVDDAVKKMMAEMAEPERKCDSCRYRNLEWDEESCDSCTMGGESCHYKPERKNGKWIKISPANIYECSRCGKNIMTDDISAYDFCHGCGAELHQPEEESE